MDVGKTKAIFSFFTVHSIQESTANDESIYTASTTSTTTATTTVISQPNIPTPLCIHGNVATFFFANKMFYFTTIDF
jgi:hypothetical protein